MPASKVGSSPRARGTLAHWILHHAENRFIPARAGNVSAVLSPSATISVHPRARGERPTGPAGGGTPIGSSPRARGTYPAGRPSHRVRRFIPARAGNVAPASLHRRRRPVHPRARGEREKLAGMTGDLAGSSPRARGTFECVAAPVVPARFIPARAGNVWTSRSRASAPSVHPRARGERCLRGAASARAAGSSPRARGT